jgi:hypothetical protein
MNGPQRSTESRASDLSSAPDHPVVLVIGRSDQATDAYLRDQGAAIIACPFAALDRAMIDQVAADWVVFPLVAEGFDATQVLLHLGSIGFTGRATITTPRLPDHAMVLRELRALAPAMKLSLVVPQAE